MTLSDKEIYDPNLNIAAGIRWLFQKRKLASARLKREADWMEAAFAYKGVLGRDRTKEQKRNNPGIRSKLRHFYEILTDGDP